MKKNQWDSAKKKKNRNKFVNENLMSNLMSNKQ